MKIGDKLIAISRCEIAARYMLTIGKEYEVICIYADAGFDIKDDYNEIHYFTIDRYHEFFNQPIDTHYNNDNGSLYLFAEQHGLNAWEFEVIKRIVRCRKKGEFISDIEKTKRVLDLYLKEQGELYKDQIEQLNQ